MGLLTPRTGPFHRIGDRYASLFDFDHFMGRSAFEESWMVKAPRNIVEKGRGVVVEVAVPGFKNEDIEIQVLDDKIYISGEKSSSYSDEEYIKKEVPTRLEPQVIPIPEDSDQDLIAAEVRNGMLYITIPYSDEINHVKKKVSVK